MTKVGMTRVGNPKKAWAALVVGAVIAAVAAAVLVVALDAGPAQAATPTRATVEATQFTVGSRTTGEAFAKCPGTKRVVGGGVVQSGTAESIEVQASGPLDATGVTLNTADGDVAKQWYAAVRNFSETQRTFKVFALCSGTSNATIEATQFTVGRFTTGEAFAKCPGTKRALGGGVVQSGAAGDLIVGASGPLDSTGITAETRDGDRAKQWYASVHHDEDGNTPTVRVFALCSGASSATIEATGFRVASGSTGEAFAVCPGTKRALGGGVVQSGVADGLYMNASGPLDATGVTLNTADGDRAKQWYAAVRNASGTQRAFKVFGICE